MINEESMAISALRSSGCWIESTDGRTTSVRFEDCINPTYDDLQYLAVFPYLERVCFYGTPVDGEILSSLTCNQSLTNLNLNCTSITQNDAKLLAQFPKLQSVGLMATPTDDECLESLLSCAEITDLRIDDSEVTASGTTRLAENLDLDTLWIGGKQLSAESLAAISRLERLREFNVCGEFVVDDHINILLTFPKPECLFIRNTSISNSGLKLLANVDPNASNVG